MTRSRYGEEAAVRRQGWSSNYTEKECEDRLQDLQVSGGLARSTQHELIEFRIRKVKCDETYPLCNRCVSTGRICDGYGVWGGGGSPHGRHLKQLGTRSGVLNSWKPASTLVSVAGQDEKLRFKWFLDRTVKKIPGIFTLDFFETLLLPASFSEPAVLHAVLSVSCIHQFGTHQVGQVATKDPAHNINEKLVLQHYIKATHELRRSSEDKQSIRILLITCLLFAYLELLRGRFRTAKKHTFAGLKILQEKQRQLNSSGKENDHVQLTPGSKEVADDWIAAAFSRLYVQVQLWSEVSNPSEVFVLISPLDRHPQFTSINEAWRQLERIFCDIIFLSRQHHLLSSEDSQNPTLLECREGVQLDLAWWQKTFERSNLYHRDEARTAVATPVLYAYHAMATIMAHTCLSNTETVYDDYTELFLKILAFSSSIWIARMPVALPDNMLNMSRSIVDIGWLPLLYYTAIKCRINRIRLHAIRLLESTSHREGIWDARITAAVARNVMRIEESGTNGFMDGDECFALHELPATETLSKVSLPSHMRVSSLQVVLPDEPGEHVLLRYIQGGSPGECAIRLR